VKWRRESCPDVIEIREDTKCSSAYPQLRRGFIDVQCCSVIPPVDSATDSCLSLCASYIWTNRLSFAPTLRHSMVLDENHIMLYLKSCAILQCRLPRSCWRCRIQRAISVTRQSLPFLPTASENVGGSSRSWFLRDVTRKIGMKSETTDLGNVIETSSFQSEAMCK